MELYKPFLSTSIIINSQEKLFVRLIKLCLDFIQNEPANYKINSILFFFSDIDSLLLTCSLHSSFFNFSMIKKNSSGRLFCSHQQINAMFDNTKKLIMRRKKKKRSVNEKVNEEFLFFPAWIFSKVFGLVLNV